MPVKKWYVETCCNYFRQGQLFEECSRVRLKTFTVSYATSKYFKKPKTGKSVGVDPHIYTRQLPCDNGRLIKIDNSVD